MNDLCFVERCLHVQYGLLGRLEYRIQAAQDRHRQDHITVLAPDIQIPEHIVGDAPDEVGNPV